MDHGKFSVAEMFSNSSNGKTSVGKVAGFFLVVVGALTFSTSLIIIRDAATLNVVSMWSGGAIFLGSGLILGKLLKPTQDHKLHE